MIIHKLSDEPLIVVIETMIFFCYRFRTLDKSTCRNDLHQNIISLAKGRSLTPSICDLTSVAAACKSFLTMSSSSEIGTSLKLPTLDVNTIDSPIKEALSTFVWFSRNSLADTNLIINHFSANITNGIRMITNSDTILIIFNYLPISLFLRFYQEQGEVD